MHEQKVAIMPLEQFKNRQLKKLGAYLRKKHQHHHADTHHVIAEKAVDLTGEFQSDIFHQQRGQVVRHLFGNKALRWQSMMTTFIPNEKIDKLQEVMYERLAMWSRQWALFDLKKDSRFGRLAQLSDEEKIAFVHDVNDQNRALAVLGGVFGFFGLKGVVLDTAWLLLVSLKSVYQLSLIYEQPLLDKAGIKMAYGVLGGANLDKLQEKQMLMTALALGDIVLKNAQETSVVDALKDMGKKYQYGGYDKSLDELAKYVDLDKFNPKWLHWLLPIGSSVASGHYNVDLIDEVLDVAWATFAAKQPKLLLDDKINA